jgi:hypothetical protein
MEFYNINIGTEPNDTNSDTTREAFDKVNKNFLMTTPIEVLSVETIKTVASDSTADPDSYDFQDIHTALEWVEALQNIRAAKITLKLADGEHSSLDPTKMYVFTGNFETVITSESGDKTKVKLLLANSGQTTAALFKVASGHELQITNLTAEAEELTYTIFAGGMYAGIHIKLENLIIKNFFYTLYMQRGSAEVSDLDIIGTGYTFSLFFNAYIKYYGTINISEIIYDKTPFIMNDYGTMYILADMNIIASDGQRMRRGFTIYEGGRVYHQSGTIKISYTRSVAVLVYKSSSFYSSGKFEINESNNGGFVASQGGLLHLKYEPTGTNITNGMFLGRPVDALYNDGSVLKVEERGVPISLEKAAGTTSDRPPYTKATGTPYFDSELGKPIWFNGTDWVDADGVAV